MEITIGLSFFSGMIVGVTAMTTFLVLYLLSEEKKGNCIFLHKHQTPPTLIQQALEKKQSER